MTLSLPWLQHLLFIATRLSVLFLFTPMQVIRNAPIQIRILIIFSLSSLLLINSSVSPSENMLLSCTAEFINGLFLALSISVFFTVYQIAGQLIDNQLGINSLAFFKPDEPGQDSLSARLLSMLAVVFFFSSNSHLWFFKGLTYSFIIIPPGTLTLFSGFMPVLKQFSFMFYMAFLIASPLVISLLSLDFCFALVTRNMPYLNSYFFTLPLKIVLGLIIVILLLPYLNSVNEMMLEHCLQTWQELMS